MTQEKAEWITKAEEAIRASSLESSIYVGCDSVRYKSKKGQWMARYSTVIVIHKDSRHGCMVHHGSIELPDYGEKTQGLRQRLMNEVSFAITTVMEILDAVGERHLEIHLDINSNEVHKSNVAAKEALGYVKGTLGIDARIKPYGWAATHAADHAVKYMN